MNLQDFLCGSQCRQLVLVIVFTNLVYHAVLDDVQYEAWAPQNCGYGPNINYPCWIFGEQESYCGYPNFKITCKDIYPILNFSDGEFIIKDIFHANHSIILLSAPVYQDSCVASLRNISLERTPFNLSSANDNFFFYYNCSSMPSFPNYLVFPVNCVGDSTHHSFAIFPKHALQEMDNYSAVGSYGPPVSVPVDVNADILRLWLTKNYTKVMKTGFLLNWNAINCSYCKGNEGRYGLENNNFFCFCQDGPHSRTNNDGKCMRVNMQ